MWHYAWQSLNNLGTFIGWGLTRLGDGCKSLFSRATTTKSDKFLVLKRKRDNGTIQSARHNVHKNDQTEASIQGISLDEEEFHTEINIKEDNHKPLNALKDLDLKGSIFEVINPILINPILKNPNGEREISNKHVGFNAKVAVLKDGVKSFKEKDFSDKGRNKNEGMIRKSSYEVADELKSLKGSDLKKSFIQIGGKLIKKSKQW
jgi:hypothetical protein